MLKTLFTALFCCTIFYCSAQKQLLSYQDLQYILKNRTEAVTTFLKDKNYQLQPGLAANQVRFLGLFADEDYSDITVIYGTRHATIHLITTDKAQVEEIQKAVASYPSKNSKGVDIYRVKDAAVNTIGIKEEETKGKIFKVYTIDLER